MGDSNLNKGVVEEAIESLRIEYSAMRAASLSRDQRKGQFENFMLIVISAAIAGSPSIVTGEYYILFLVLSIVLSAIFHTYHEQSSLLHELIEYEEELKDRLNTLLKIKADKNSLPEELNNIWGWQSFHRGNEASQPLSSYRVIKRLVFLDVGSLFFIGSFGFILAYIHNVEVKSLSNIEYFVLGLALFYCGSIFVSKVLRFIRD